MKRRLIKTLCCFVPVKKWRHNLRDIYRKQYLYEEEVFISEEIKIETPSIVEEDIAEENIVEEVIEKIIIKEETTNIKEEEILVTSFIPAIGSDFKEYVLTHNMPKVIKDLKRDLDELSIKHIDFMLDAIMNFPSYSKADMNFFKNKPIMEWYPKWLKKEAEKSDKGNKDLWEKGFWGGIECNYYKHGLTLLPTKVRKYTEGKVFLDLGAWDGDSATALAECKPSEIWSFEISQKNIDKYNENTSNLKVSNKVFKLALSRKKGTMSFDDNGTWSDTVMLGGKDTVKVDTLDNFMKNKKETIGFIKADIEGDEINMLKGAKKTIAKDLPVLSISMYHDPISFFEIKKLIESWNLGYKFIVRVMGFYDCGPINEASIIAYPGKVK